MNASKRSAISTNGGASATIASLMPVRRVMAGGIARPGFTRVWSSSTISPPHSFTAAISVTRWGPGRRPVVSTSTTT